jgi:PAS domain S-box-containing protein
MNAERKNLFKKIIEKIQAGDDLEIIKSYFSEKLGVVTPAELSFYENELIKEKVPKEDIQRMRDIQLELYKKSVENQKHIVPAGHPIHTLMSEHVIVMEYANELDNLIGSIAEGVREPKPEFLVRIRELIGFLAESESHYQREENSLFAILEKHGLTGPPQAMWSMHQEIHKLEKEIFDLNSESDAELSNNIGKMKDAASALAEHIADHFHKENNIIFPASMRMFSEKDWEIVVQDFDDIGYCSYTPRPERKEITKEDSASFAESGEVTFGSGTLTLEQLELLFNHLPVDTTFVDEQDKVRFFSESPNRIFVRSRAIIGRSVQLCHPKDSVHIVQKILDDFRAGKRESAEFWLNLGGKMVLIKYFAVRNSSGKYLGCLEVSQDITEIRKIEGEKRLLEE